MILETRTHKLYASHHQFYVQDAQTPGNTGDPTFWTEETTQKRLAILPHTIGIGTGSFGTVTVTTEIHNAPPPLDLARWDHVTEASVTLPSGQLQVIGCLEATGEIFQVAPGAYRLRACHANLVQSQEWGEGGDWYLVQLWPQPLAAPNILKSWQDNPKRVLLGR